MPRKSKQWRQPPSKSSVTAKEKTVAFQPTMPDTVPKGPGTKDAKWNYMTKQPDITFAMRSILVDWLVEVGEEYKLHSETLFLAVNYIDRFLSKMSVKRDKLQLVGAACMFIAAKYEEI